MGSTGFVAVTTGQAKSGQGGYVSIAVGKEMKEEMPFHRFTF